MGGVGGGGEGCLRLCNLHLVTRVYKLMQGTKYLFLGGFFYSVTNYLLNCRKLSVTALYNHCKVLL